MKMKMTKDQSWTCCILNELNNLHPDPIIPCSIDRSALDDRGWMSFALTSSSESDLRVALFALANDLGIPTATRSGGVLCDMLLPIEAGAAKPRSLSKIHAV